MVRLFHSSGGISASRRSITASLVETICTTLERPWTRSSRIAAIRVGDFRPASSAPKKRSLAPSKADMTAEAA